MDRPNLLESPTTAATVAATTRPRALYSIDQILGTAAAAAAAAAAATNEHQNREGK